VRDIVVPPAGECWQLFRSVPPAVDAAPAP
jgi:hypothetical protein